jgi:hypothetical protein
MDELRKHVEIARRMVEHGDASRDGLTALGAELLHVQAIVNNVMSVFLREAIKANVPCPVVDGRFVTMVAKKYLVDSLGEHACTGFQVESVARESTRFDAPWVVICSTLQGPEGGRVWYRAKIEHDGTLMLMEIIPSDVEKESEASE